MRRLVARTMSQQSIPAKRATARASAWRTKLTLTVTSVDGLGAYDKIADGAMLRGFMSVSGSTPLHAHDLAEVPRTCGKWTMVRFTASFVRASSRAIP